MLVFSRNRVFRIFQNKYHEALKYIYLRIISWKLPKEIVLKGSLAINLTDKRFVVTCLKNDVSTVICKVTTVANAETLKLEQRNVNKMRGILEGSELQKLIPEQLGITKGEQWFFYMEEQLLGKTFSTLDNLKLLAASKISSKLFEIFTESQCSNKRLLLNEFNTIISENFATHHKKSESIITYLDDVDVRFCLQHGDFWASNILFDNSNNVKGVIDWDSLGVYFAGFDIFHLFFMNENELKSLEIGELIPCYYDRLPPRFEALLDSYYQDLGLAINDSKVLVIFYWISFIVRTNKQAPLKRKSQGWKQKNIIAVIDFFSKR